MSKTTIVQDVLDVFRAAGFEVRVSEFGNKPETIIYGTSDNAGILMESVCEHFGSSTEAAFSRAQRENKDGSAPLTAPALLTEEQKEDQFWDAENWERAREKARARMAAPAHQQSEGLSDERIEELNREAQDQGISGIAPSIYLARAIEREVAKAAPAAPVQTAEPSEVAEMVRTAMKRAYNLGQTYWQQADGEYTSQHKKAGVTAGRFIELTDETCAKVEASVAAPVQADQAQAEPVAYLHQVVCGDGEPDQALSFEPDNFPLAGTLGYRSLSHQPLYAALALPAQAEQVAAVPDIVREAVEAAFEDRAGWRTKIAGAVRALATKEAAAQVPAEKGGAA